LEWRNLHSEERHDTKYYPGDQIKNNEIGGHVARMGDRRGAYEVLLGKSEEERPLGRTRHRWTTDVTTNLKEISWECMDLIDLTRTGTGGGLV